MTPQDSYGTRENSRRNRSARTERSRARDAREAPSSAYEESDAFQDSYQGAPPATARTALRRRRAANASRRPSASRPSSRPLASRRRHSTHVQQLETGSEGVQPVVKPETQRAARRAAQREAQQAQRIESQREQGYNRLLDRLPDPTIDTGGDGFDGLEADYEDIGYGGESLTANDDAGSPTAYSSESAVSAQSQERDDDPYDDNPYRDRSRSRRTKGARSSSRGSARGSHGRHHQKAAGDHAKGRGRSARADAAQEVGDAQGEPPVVPVVPVRDIGPTKRRKSSAAMRARALMVILAIFAGLAALTLFVWMTRTVEFKLNNEDVTTSYGTTLADYVASHDLSYTPGDLVSVNGKVLLEGGGDAYAASVNGTTFTPETAKNVMLTGGEVVDLGNGLDAMEDYDVEIIKSEPKLEFDGSVGVISYVEQWGKAGTQEQWTGKISGEVAYGDYVEAPQNVIVKTLNIAPTDGRKLVALTFDDGPSTYTPQILDILAQYNAKGTFFMLRGSVEEYPETAKMVADAGHQIASHMVHQSVSNLSAEEFQTALSNTYSAITEATGVETTFFRPPFGAFDEEDWLRSGGLMSASIIWNTDSLDWETPGSSTIVEHALMGVGNGSVILLHDGGGDRSQDLAALPSIIEQLQSQGYQLVTLDELLKSDSTVNEAITNGNEKMPEGSVWPTELAESPDEDEAATN